MRLGRVDDEKVVAASNNLLYSTYKMSTLTVWQDLECHVGLWCACLPPLQPLLRLALYKLGLCSNLKLHNNPTYYIGELDTDQTFLGSGPQPVPPVQPIRAAVRCRSLDGIMVLSRVRERDIVGNAVPESMDAAEKKLERPSEATIGMRKPGSGKDIWQFCDMNPETRY